MGIYGKFVPKYLSKNLISEKKRGENKFAHMYQKECWVMGSQEKDKCLMMLKFTSLQESVNIKVSYCKREGLR
jgi:hypothetical protein